MVTRREVVTTGALGALSAAAGAEAGTRTGAQNSDQVTAEALARINNEINKIREILDYGQRGPSVDFGIVGAARRQFELFIRANQKFPDYCEVGLQSFTELYDWHVRYQQPIEITRVDNRMALRFMFTWMILMPNQDPAFIGIPYDRG